MNRTSHNDYLEYYDTETAMIVSDVYRDDFERFEYSSDIATCFETLQT